MNKEAQAIVDKINKENEEKYGSQCKKCNMFESWCRCESYKKYQEEEQIKKLS